jgi:DNA polymerase-3 subunit alpha
VELRHKNLLPQFEVGGGEDAGEFLDRLAHAGLDRKLGKDAPPHYQARLVNELHMIRKMGFTSYFLIVWDFIRHAKKQGIPVGPGRGSAAGSLVSYCLDITEIDPIRYNLLFERFLNPERVSMPDIDVDFCQDRRQEVINYVAEKYGADHVAQIITFGTMKAKAAIRDVGRAMDIPYAEVDRIAKLIPNDLKITIEEALKKEPQLKQAYETDESVRELLMIAMRLEGLNRHASTHAAGVVISPEPLTNYAPLYRNPADESIVTQFEMKALEKVGLLKFDFLGLKTLTVIEKTLEYIKQAGGEFALEGLSLDDAQTYELLSSGQTAGVFQLESEGMRDILIRMQPNRFEDLIALVALYRPGPMQWIDDFIKRKKGETKVTYLMPQLKEILDETYGIILYQEQVMLIANKIANFSMGQADILRKAMGKKNAEEMEKQKEVFIRGAIKNGITEKKAKRLFEMMEPFAQYGFNKSHSAAYAYIAYQTAYLKAHYPVAFMAATLTLDMSDSDKIVKSINECRKMKIEMLPPDINLSGREFRVIGNSIRFGLEAVKGVGGAAIEQMLEVREENGPFVSPADLLKRVDTRKVNKKVLEGLVKAGAFDSLGISRAVAMEAVSEGLNGSGRSFRNVDQVSMFGDESEYPQPSVAEWDEPELLKNEKEALGFYITGHPLTRYDMLLSRVKAKKTSVLEQAADKSEILIGGILRAVKKKNVKSSGELMAYLTLEDDEGSVEVIVFPSLYKTAYELLKKDAVVLVKGSIDKDEKGVRLRGVEISDLEDADKKSVTRMEISLKVSGESTQSLHQLRSLVSEYPGDCQLYLRIHGGRSQTVIATAIMIKPDTSLVNRIESMAGRGAVRVS